MRIQPKALLFFKQATLTGILTISSIVWGSNLICMDWLQSNLPGSCAVTGIKHEGGAFIDVNQVPVSFYTASERFANMCPSSYLGEFGYCNIIPSSVALTQQLFRGCFDKEHLLLGDNTFYYFATVTSSSTGESLDHCTNMVDNILLRLPNGESVLLFALVHRGTAASGKTTINLSFSKIDPGIAAIIENQLKELEGLLEQLESVSSNSKYIEEIEKGLDELTKKEQQLRDAESKLDTERAKFEKSYENLNKLRTRLPNHGKILDEGKLLKNTYDKLKQLHSGHIGTLTVRELLRLALENENQFRERDLAHLIELAQNIADRTHRHHSEMQRALDDATQKLTDIQKRLESKIKDSGIDEQNAALEQLQLKIKGSLDAFFNQKANLNVDEACEHQGPGIFEQLANESLQKLQQTVSGKMVHDRPTFLSVYNSWLKQHILASKTLSSTLNVCRNDIVAFEQATYKVQQVVRHYFDEQEGWFLDANVPQELRYAITELQPHDSFHAKKLKEALNLWSTESPQAEQQKLVAIAITAFIKGYVAEISSKSTTLQRIMAMQRQFDDVIKIAKNIAVSTADIGTGFVPVVGDFKDFCEAVTGKQFCAPNGKTLSSEDRLFAAIGVFIGSRAFWKAISYSFQGGVKGIKEFSELLEKEGDLVKIAEELAPHLKAAIKTAIESKKKLSRDILEQLAQRLYHWVDPDKLKGFKKIGDAVYQSPAGLIYGKDDRFGNRIFHVLSHTYEAADKRPPHSLFSLGKENVLEVLDEAWKKRQIKCIDKGKEIFEIMFPYVIGREGEKMVRIVVQPGTSEVLSAYPILKQKC